MAWKWLVRRTRESKPFFFAFATICGIVPGVIGFGVMTATNTRSDQLESKLRSKARPESLAIPDLLFPSVLNGTDKDIEGWKTRNRKGISGNEHRDHVEIPAVGRYV
ncbi:hypothetical protein L195_g028011 [Trifolium pratense]|uniref:Uncharacterized protein n=1 Tax=Trifolium pratense TaxID=57577 RepID=A0A2K3L0R2_TRIPR|nr:hypothetical protein L195_g028011 [Trifolium pratense]